MAESTIADDLLQREGEDVCNAKTICCKLCPSTILLPGKGKLVKKPVSWIYSTLPFPSLIYNCVVIFK